MSFWSREVRFIRLVRVIFLIGLLCVIGTELRGKEESLPEVQPMDWSIASPDEVSDRDLYPPRIHGGHSLAYYLDHFHRLANAVREEEPHRGFIDLSVWRRPRDNRPYNARVMENITSLAWMYTREAPWNPYHGDPATRARLEAALRYWLEIQNDDGRFSEYGSGNWNLAATAFATKFMSQTLHYLQNGPAIDSELHQQVVEANRRAILVTLNDEDLYEHGRHYTNQYGNVFAGATAFLRLFDDPELAKDLRRQLLKSRDDFLSTAGYLYESSGPDWGYYFGTHHSNIRMAYHYGRHLDIDGVNIGQLFLEEYETTTEWLSYNAVLQPDRDRFLLNRAIETRTSRDGFKSTEKPLAKHVPLARAFCKTKQQRQEDLEQYRRELESDWEDPPDLQTGESSGYTPYTFLKHDHIHWYPTEQQRRNARRQLPYIARKRFIHQRTDEQYGDVYTYVRRPSYYAAFNAGRDHSGQQRQGLGLLWHPDHGTLIQSQSESTRFAWGTYFMKQEKLREADGINASYTIDGEEHHPKPGTADLSGQTITATYSMRNGKKNIRFRERSIVVEIRDDQKTKKRGRLVEHIPFLLDDGDELVVEENTVQFVRNDRPILELQFTGTDEIELIRGGAVQGLELQAVHAGGDQLRSYQIRMRP